MAETATPMEQSPAANAAQAKRRGQFVVLEGLDGAGTTTQRGLLAEALRGVGQRVEVTHEPTDGPVGRAIRETLRGEPEAAAREALPWMFAADRADHLARRVAPCLARGTWVVSDRYLHSSLAYQSLDWPLQLVDQLNRAFRAPDLTVFVDIPVDVGLARVVARGQTREIFERPDALARVAEQYEVVLALLADRGHRIVRVNGEQSIEAVQAAVWAAVCERFELGGPRG